MFAVVGRSFDATEFAKRLWGDVYYHSDTRSFKKTPQRDERSGADSSPRTFVQFVLEPFYKIISQTVGENTEQLKKTLDDLRIFLKPSQFKMDIKPLLKLVLSAFYGNSAGLVSMLVQHVPSPAAAAKHRVRPIFACV